MAADPRGLEVMRRWARVFDSAFRIPGTEIRFGIDPLLGLFPGLGDLASPVFSLFLLWHGDDLDDGPDAKLLGVYSTELAAKIERARSLPGFRDQPDAFQITAYALDKDEWSRATSRRTGSSGVPPSSA